MDQKKWELGTAILRNCRNELYRRFPDLDGAFAALSCSPEEKTKTIATDGESFYFSPEYLLPAYGRDAGAVCHGYLHMLLHCLYLHLWNVGENEPTVKSENEILTVRSGKKIQAEDVMTAAEMETGAEPRGMELLVEMETCTEASEDAALEKDRCRMWNLACDLAVEQLIERELGEQQHMAVREKTTASKGNGGILDMRILRQQCLEKLGSRALSAEQIFQLLLRGELPWPLTALEQAFCFDDHSGWRMIRETAGTEGMRRRWEQLRTYSGLGSRGGAGSMGSSPGEDREELEGIPESRRDYRRFLKQFATLREEVELDMESFDYIYYNYGMEHYGNLPLLEPLEYKEVNRLEELVIAIDTSGSCTTEMVRRFLAETYGILQEKENFFRKMKVYLIQCDCCIQNVTVIHSGEEWAEYGKTVGIQGRGGTDFRPVFRYVEELRAKKELRHLRALIYFTDGDGIYPEKKTEYETAFVFVKKTDGMEQVPHWARRLCV